MVSCNNLSHAALIFPHSSYRFCGRGGGGVTPGDDHGSFIHWSYPPKQKQNSSLKMTHCRFNDSLARHHCSFDVDMVLRKVIVTICVHVVLHCAADDSWGGITAHWMSAIMAVGSIRYSDKAHPFLHHVRGWTRSLNHTCLMSNLQTKLHSCRLIPPECNYVCNYSIEDWCI